MIDISRRGFLFGASATLILPPKRSFFIIEPPKLVVARLNPPELLLDLPTHQMLELMQKLNDKIIEVTALPRWVVLNADQYEAITGERFVTSTRPQTLADHAASVRRSA